jgi:hypothetical protein
VQDYFAQNPETIKRFENKAIAAGIIISENANGNAALSTLGNVCLSNITSMMSSKI